MGGSGNKFHHNQGWESLWMQWLGKVLGCVELGLALEGRGEYLKKPSLDLR